jgi:hypothetical protein
MGSVITVTPIQSLPGAGENKSMEENMHCKTLAVRTAGTDGSQSAAAVSDKLTVTVGRVSTARLLGMCGNHG